MTLTTHASYPDAPFVQILQIDGVPWALDSAGLIWAFHYGRSVWLPVSITRELPKEPVA